MKNKEVKLLLYDLTTKKTFYKYFDTEFERDKFIRRSKYFKKILIIKDWEV